MSRTEKIWYWFAILRNLRIYCHFNFTWRATHGLHSAGRQFLLYTGLRLATPHWPVRCSSHPSGYRNFRQFERPPRGACLPNVKKIRTTYYSGTGHLLLNAVLSPLRLHWRGVTVLHVLITTISHNENANWVVLNNEIHHVVSSLPAKILSLWDTRITI